MSQKKKRNKKYELPKNLNPALFNKRVEELNKKIERNKILSDQNYSALQNFVILLINFASHDIKNAVLNMEGVLSNANPEDISLDDIERMQLCMKNIRSTLTDFKNLGEKNIVESFELSKLIKSLELLHRPRINSENISYDVNWNDVSKELIINQNFHLILQLLNNIMLNSVWALENIIQKKIKLDIYQIGNNISFFLSDNGIGIPIQNKEKVFDTYFTTKVGGSGLGLSHVSTILDEINGKILISETENDYSTTFNMIFPIQNETLDINN